MILAAASLAQVHRAVTQNGQDGHTQAGRDYHFREQMAELGYPGLAVLLFLGACVGGLAQIVSILTGDRRRHRAA